MNFIRSLSLGGYRSFGSQVQRFETFSKINLLIGPNNSGKSNVLRFIHNVYPKLGARNNFNFDPLDRHFPNSAAFCYGQKISLVKDDKGGHPQVNNLIQAKLRDPQQKTDSTALVLRALSRKAELDETTDAWFNFNQQRELQAENWDLALRVLNDQEIYRLWRNLTGSSGGSRDQHWTPAIIQALQPPYIHISAAMIPAIRQVGAKGSESKHYSGEGIIERLARLQNPDVHSQSARATFERISIFLQSVTDNQSARIEIPYERDTIIVHMDGKALPLESLGTGIHEVIILAAAATILDNAVVCMEEPEIHLNPVLQRKLVRYLAQATSNQYFISTHSAALMDTPDAEVHHIRLANGQSHIERVTSDRHRSTVCEDLGYHPSDLLLANCLIWVEGPSDRIYLRHWISKRAPGLHEGIHYSIMFYGGRLASHITGNDVDEAVAGFISLRRLNRRAVIVIDSDRATNASPLNTTKMRLVDEFNAGPGHAWVTHGREIENYLPADQIISALAKVAITATAVSRFRRYDKALSVRSAAGKLQQAPKVEIAKHIVESFELDESRYDLRKRLDALVAFIHDSNPSYELVTG